MTCSIIDLSTPTSPRFEHEEPGCVTGTVVPRDALTAGDRDAMYALFDAYFSRADRTRFESDLAEKESVVLLRDDAGAIQGFSTFMRMRAFVDGQEIVAFFSGDTIVAREHWNETVLSRLWSRTIFSEAESIQRRSPRTRVYWLLICSGYKTWRFLPVFFREFFPNPDCATPDDVKLILDTLATSKFPHEYLPFAGVVRFRHPTPLRPGIGEITAARRGDSRIAFFEKKNPRHAAGDELVCITEISRANVTRAGQRMVGAP